MNLRAQSKGSIPYLTTDSVDTADLEPFSPDLYSEIGLNQLLVYAVSYLEEQRYRGTIENIAVVAHRFFPNKYSLIGYPQFPDAARVQRVILHLGPKYVGLLEGKNKIGYHLNDRGKIVAGETAQRLAASSIHSINDAPEPDFLQDNVANRTAVETRIPRIRNSGSFTKFESGKGRDVDDVSLTWEALGLFVSAAEGTKFQAYRELVEAARRHGDEEVEDFLKWIARTRPYIVGTRHTH